MQTRIELEGGGECEFCGNGADPRPIVPFNTDAGDKSRPPLSNPDSSEINFQGKI